VSIDRVVTWGVAARLLALARRSGAERIDLLFTRGTAAGLPDGTPPEATWVLASDFIALPIEIVDGGVEASPETPFETVAASIIERARRGELPVRVAVPDVSR
jgi:hypothetical protein